MPEREQQEPQPPAQAGGQTFADPQSRAGAVTLSEAADNGAEFEWLKVTKARAVGLPPSEI